jgi:hypothetical protein
MPDAVSTPGAFVKCACISCHCAVDPAHGVTRDGKVFCSQTCAYDCTETTCVCVHEKCDEHPHEEGGTCCGGH